MSFLMQRRKLASCLGLVLLLSAFFSVAGLRHLPIVFSQALAATVHPVSPNMNPERIFLNGFEAQNTTCDPIDTDADNDGLLDVACLSVFTPPDPASVATPINPTVVTNFLDANQFIYSGTSPIQRGVSTGVIQNYRAAVLRGKVVDADQNPLPGVLVRVLNHIEVGYTYTRADGVYDLVVNGGGELIVDYRKNGYLRAQRSAITPWQDWKWLPQTTLIALDSNVTTVGLNATTGLQLHRASVQTDSNGTRQATIMFPAGTQATLIGATGASQPLSTMHFRATEYTVGDRGPERMPASLPVSSAYTYAIELSADEAINSDAREVRFNHPIALYFENYRGFPVGAHVPLGYYDFRLGSWLPSDDGRVIQIVSNSGGFADIDLDGSGHAADAATLTRFGFSDAERAELAILYPVGQTLWRSQVGHLTPWDANFPWGFPPDSSPPPPPPPDEPDPDDGSGGSGPDPDEPDPHDPGPPPPGGDDHASDPGTDDHPDPDADSTCGSIIDCNNATLGEVVPITGTPYSMVYRSDRVPGGNLETLRVRVPITGPTMPSRILRIVVNVSLGGTWRSFTLNPPVTNYTYEFSWDGRDAYGRPWQGPIRAQVMAMYIYPMTFYRSRIEQDRSFASMSGFPVGVITSGSTAEGVVTRQWTSNATVRGRPRQIGFWDARGFNMGGWSLSAHHVFDPLSRTIYFGDGHLRRVGEVSSNDIVGVEPYDAAAFGSGESDTIGPDGSLFHLQPPGEGGQREVILRLRPGQTTPDVLAQNCPPSPSYDGACVTGATPSWLHGSRLLVNERGVLTLLTHNGIYELIAPSYTPTLRFDPSTLAQPCSIDSTSWQFEQRMYFICQVWDDYSLRLYMRWPNGEVSLVMGDGVRSDSGAPASETALGAVGQMVIAPTGDLYFTELSTSRIRRLSPTGIVTTVAGTGMSGFAADGSMAATSPINMPSALAVSLDGTVLFADSGRIREIALTGQLHTLLGGGTETLDPRGTNIARRIAIYTNYINVLPDGGLVFDGGAGLLRWSRSSFRFDSEGANYRFPSEDGSELYVFDSRGRHLQTLNTLTGAVTRTFSYNSDGYLIGVSDGDNNLTLIARNSSNVALTIISPYGLFTNLDPGSSGMLNRITAPTGQTWNFTYKPGFTGLLATFTSPRGNASTMDWDLTGHLQRDTNAESGFKALTQTQWNPLSARQGTVTTAMGRQSTHSVHQYPGGARFKSNQLADDTYFERVMTSAYVESENHSNVYQTTRRYEADPRFGLTAPIIGSSAVKLPDTGLITGPTHQTTMARNVTPIVPGADVGQLDLDETVTVNDRAYTRHYNAALRRWTLTSPEGRTRTLTLDAQARPLSVVVPGLAAVDYHYDTHGRLDNVASGSGADRREWQYGYDSRGYLNAIRDPLLRNVTLTNDDAGRPIAQALPDGRTIALGYDANNNIISITPPGRSAHQFTYNRVDKVTGYQPPPLGSTTTNSGYFNNTDSQLDHSDDADARRTSLSYATGSLLPSIVTIPEGTRSMIYIGAQRLYSITATDGVSNGFTWSGPLPTSQNWTGEVAGSVTYAYDNTSGHSNFWLSSVAVNSSVIGSLSGRIDYRYDQDGLMTRATLAPYSGSSIVLDLTRNPSNGLLTGTTLGSLTDTWGYNAFAEPTDYSANYASTALYSASHVRDKLGRITQTTETLSGVTHVIVYGYDLAGRLHTVTRDGIQTADYEYDSNSNRASLTTSGGTKSGTYDAQDRMTAYSGDTFTYNYSGQLTGRTTTAGGAYTAYQYDTLSNLRHVTLPSGTTIDYVIDGMNRRVGKKINATLVQGFLYQNQLRPIAELDRAGAVVSTFVYAERSNIPSYMLRGGHIYRIVADHLGSPRLVVDIADGSIVQRLDYDEFGNVLADTNPGFQPFGFAGGIYDRDTGLIRFGARDYDPITGRWTSKDPIKFEGGDTNFYAYVGSNPLSFTDSNGMCLEDLCIGEGIAAYEAGAWLAGLGAAWWAAHHITDSNSMSNQGDPPFTGPPGSTSSGNGKSRTYGDDGWPATDVDTGHDHGAGDPHAHDWGRPEGGGKPTHKDRGPGRPLQPGDPPSC